MAIKATDTPLGIRKFGNFQKILRKKPLVTIENPEPTEAQKQCKHLYCIQTNPDEDGIVIETCQNPSCGRVRKLRGFWDDVVKGSGVIPTPRKEVIMPFSMGGNYTYK